MCLRVIRRACANDADAMFCVMTSAAGALKDKRLYVCDDLNYVRRCVNTDGFGVVACDEKQEVVGALLCRFPGREADNLGRDLAMTEEELDQIVHMESAAVLPECCGSHLMERMLCYAEIMIREGGYQYLLATASPENPASFKTLEKCGFRLEKTKEKYGGLLRGIYRKIL